MTKRLYFHSLMIRVVIYADDGSVLHSGGLSGAERLQTTNPPPKPHGLLHSCHSCLVMLLKGSPCAGHVGAGVTPQTPATPLVSSSPPRWRHVANSLQPRARRSLRRLSDTFREKLVSFASPLGKGSFNLRSESCLDCRGVLEHLWLRAITRHPSAAVKVSGVRGERACTCQRSMGCSC